MQSSSASSSTSTTASCSSSRSRSSKNHHIVNQGCNSHQSQKKTLSYSEDEREHHPANDGSVLTAFMAPATSKGKKKKTYLPKTSIMPEGPHQWKMLLPSNYPDWELPLDLNAIQQSNVTEDTRIVQVTEHNHFCFNSTVPLYDDSAHTSTPSLVKFIDDSSSFNSLSFTGITSCLSTRDFSNGGLQTLLQVSWIKNCFTKQ